VLTIDAELPLDGITPEMFEALQKLEPFGAGHHEPVFCANGVRLLNPVKILKDKHVRMKLSPGQSASGWRRSLAYDALGWRLAERVQKEELLPGYLLDVAFTIGHNEHPELGGIELTLKDFKTRARATAHTTAT
jgi:single-stranded-DNA-specific exonuclease